MLCDLPRNTRKTWFRRSDINDPSQNRPLSGLSHESVKVPVHRARSFRRCFLCNALRLLSEGVARWLVASELEPAKQLGVAWLGISRVHRAGNLGPVAEDAIAPRTQAVFNSA